MSALGYSRTTPFDASRAIPFTTDPLNGALIRMPEIAPDAAWQVAQHELERRAAADCQLASNAQHHEKFAWQVMFGQPRWTLLLLPVYITSYTADDGKRVPLSINGESGLVNGIRLASIKTASRWSLLIGGIALAVFFLLVLSVILSLVTEQVRVLSGFLLLITLALMLAAPVPLIVAWQFNRSDQ